MSTRLPGPCQLTCNENAESPPLGVQRKTRGRIVLPVEAVIRGGRWTHHREGFVGLSQQKISEREDIWTWEQLGREQWVQGGAP